MTNKDITDKEKMEVMEILDSLLDKMADKWTLRMRCHSFIMLVNKSTGAYVNIYHKSFLNREVVDTFADKLEKHKNFI